MNMSKKLKGIGIALVICLLSMPIAIFATFALTGFWSWFESTFAIEALGHSGPAEWCYLAVYIVILACATAIWSVLRRGHGS